MEFEARLAGNTMKCDVLVEALAASLVRFPARYAALAPAQSWRTRDWRVEEFEDGGAAHTQMGLDLAGHLPGVSWWALFGREVAAHLGRDLLLALPVAQTIDLGVQAGSSCVPMPVRIKAQTARRMPPRRPRATGWGPLTSSTFNTQSARASSSRAPQDRPNDQSQAMAGNPCLAYTSGSCVKTTRERGRRFMARPAGGQAPARRRGARRRFQR